MRYVIARHNNEIRDMTYRAFISDELYYINNNIANNFGGMTLQMRYVDMLVPKKEETRTAEEIIEGIKTKMRNL